MTEGVSEFSYMISSGKAIISPSKLLSHSGPPFTHMTLLLMTESQFPELVWCYICGMTPLASSTNTLKTAGLLNAQSELRAAIIVCLRLFVYQSYRVSDFCKNKTWIC